mgnify:CR=1 FL=1
MSAKIEYNNAVVATVESGKVATLPVKDLKMATNIKVEAVKDALNLQRLPDITPGEDYQNFSAESRGIDGFSEVIVNPIPDKYKDVSNLSATANMVLNGQSYYGADGRKTGTLTDHYTEGDHEIVLSVTNPRADLDGAYRGSAYIIPEELNITENDTYYATSGTVISKVTVNVQVEVWDGRGISYS